MQENIQLTHVNPGPHLKSDVNLDSIQETMDINKEALKRRLMFRRTLPELVELGIYPTLNTPPAFVEQSRNLERAKARDQLQKKLKSRPDRKCLVQHHILEDTNPLVDRSLQDKQRLLKRSRLQDNLRDHLAHRPGPLELLSKNILLLNSDPGGEISSDIGPNNDESFKLIIPEFSKSNYPNVTVTTVATELYPTISSSESFSSFDSLADISILESDLSSPETTNFLTYSLDPGIYIPPAPDITPLLLSNPSMGNPRCTIPPPPPLPRSASPMRNLKSNKKPKTNKVKPIKFHEYKGPKSAKENKINETMKVDPDSLRMMVEQERQVLTWRLNDQSLGADDIEMSIEELRSRLDDLKAMQLQEICKQLGIKASGSKPDRIERIVNKLISTKEVDTNVQQGCNNIQMNVEIPSAKDNVTTISNFNDDVSLKFINFIKQKNESLNIINANVSTINNYKQNNNEELQLKSPILEEKINLLKESFIKMAIDMGLSVDELLNRLNLQLTTKTTDCCVNQSNNNFINYSCVGTTDNNYINATIKKKKVPTATLR